LFCLFLIAFFLCFFPFVVSKAPKAANSQVHPEQKEKMVDHTSLRSTSAAHGVNSTRSAQNNEVKPPVPPAAQPGPANILIGLPAPQGITFVPAQSIYSSHGEISKKVQQIMQSKRDSTHPSWTPPSSDYMNKPLICQSCNAVVTDVDSLLICDVCERGTHIRCLESNGTKVQVPKAEWHCQKCLAASHGKALPPKYGKVTRTLGGAKAVTVVRKENLQLKDDQKKTIPNGLVTNQPNSVPGVNSGNVNNVQAVSDNPKERAVAPSAGTGIKIEAATGVKTEHHHSQNSQSDKSVTSEPKDPLGEKGKALPEQHPVNKDSNQVNGITASEKSAGPEVCWVGDAGEVIDGKSYYSSCRINKTTYKLQDHVLISSDGGRFIPSKIKARICCFKLLASDCTCNIQSSNHILNLSFFLTKNLQSLWESKEPGSKWAVVNPYYLPSDLPESVSCSSGGVEDNEVKGSVCCMDVKIKCYLLLADSA
jgi:PHD-finger